MFDNKNKNHLYMALQHRNDHSGFHWGLLIAPKVETRDTTLNDCHLFHVTDSQQPGCIMGPDDKILWRFQDKTVSPLRSGNLICEDPYCLLVHSWKTRSRTSVVLWALRVFRLFRATVDGLAGSESRLHCQYWVIRRVISRPSS